jgi:hypothetical protein
MDMTPHPHRRAGEPGVEYHERNTDNDKLARFNAIWDRYIKLIIPVLWGGLIWIFTQVVPAVKGYPLILQRLEQAEKDRGTINTSVKILIRMQCLNLNAVDRAKIDLDCTQIPLPTQQELRNLK